MSETQEDAPDPRTLANLTRANQRKKLTETVSQMRDHINSATGKSLHFDYEMCMRYARERQGTLPAVGILSALAGLISLMWADPLFVPLWFAATICVHFLTVFQCRKVLKAERTKIRVKRVIERLLILEGIQGFLWVALFFLPVTATPVFDVPLPFYAYDIMQFSILITYIAVMTSIAYALPVATILATLPPTLNVVFVFSQLGAMMHWVMAGVSVGACFFFVYFGWRLRRTAIESLMLRAEKDALIVELEHANAISDDARKHAEDANLAKSRFLATMSHELRTPLNAILGFSEVMKNEIMGPLGNDTYKSYVNDIHSSGQHLLHVINEILDLSRIEAGRYDINEESLQLSEVAEECSHLISLKAEKKDITVVEELTGDLPRMWADEKAIRQVVLNLLSNAVKFTPIGGKIIIKTGWTTAGGLYVSVTDNGPGIPENEIPIVLSQFGQGSLAQETAEDGTGLGLPIVQRLVHMHDGRFDLRSKVRVGTQAIALFPPSRVMNAMPAIEKDEEDSLEKLIA